MGGLLAILAGCTADLSPGELVIGDDIPALTLDGQAGAELGSVLDLGENGVLVGAVGSGQVAAFSFTGQPLWTWGMGEGGARRVWWWGTSARAFALGSGVWERDADGEVRRVFDAPGATDIAPCADGSFAVVTGVGEAVVCGDEGVLDSLCDGSSCVVRRDGVVIGQTTPGSALAWVQDQACWGDIQSDDPRATGGVSCELGDEWVGAVGEHLGVAVTDDRVAGVFDKWLIPARARVLSTTGAHTWVIDRAAERSRLALAHWGDTWAVGVPGWFAQDARAGRVYLFQAQGG